MAKTRTPVPEEHVAEYDNPLSRVWPVLVYPSTDTRILFQSQRQRNTLQDIMHHHTHGLGRDNMILWSGWEIQCDQAL